jgi:hypothetical protein
VRTTCRVLALLAAVRFRCCLLISAFFRLLVPTSGNDAVPAVISGRIITRGRWDDRRYAALPAVVCTVPLLRPYGSSAACQTVRPRCSLLHAATSEAMLKPTPGAMTLAPAPPDCPRGPLAPTLRAMISVLPELGWTRLSLQSFQSRRKAAHREVAALPPTEFNPEASLEARHRLRAPGREVGASSGRWRFSSRLSATDAVSDWFAARSYGITSLLN